MTTKILRSFYTDYLIHVCFTSAFFLHGLERIIDGHYTKKSPVRGNYSDRWLDYALSQVNAYTWTHSHSVVQCRGPGNVSFSFFNSLLVSLGTDQTSLIQPQSDDFLPNISPDCTHTKPTNTTNMWAKHTDYITSCISGQDNRIGPVHVSIYKWYIWALSPPNRLPVTS